MIKVKTYSLNEIRKYIEDNEINDNTVNGRPEYFISISNSAGPEYVELFHNDHHNVLELHFEDVEEDGYKTLNSLTQQGRVWCNAMSKKQADEVVKFVSRIPKGRMLHIHCEQGLSRSVAIADVINELINDQHVDNPKSNKHVKQMLINSFKEKGIQIQGKKRYIKKYDEAELGWKIKKWFPVDIEKLQQWYQDLEKNYSDWKFVVGENQHVWQFPITDPKAETGHRLMDDTAYYTLCWNSDEPGPKPFEQGCAKPEYRDNDNDELNPRKCFDGYALDLVKGMPIRSKKWLVTIHTPGTKLITHQDAPDKIRVHIPIYTHKDSVWIIDNEEYHMETGWAYLVNTTIPHSVDNKGDGYRIHLYGKVWTEDVRKLNL